VPFKLPLYKFCEKQKSVQAVVADMQPGGKNAAEWPNCYACSCLLEMEEATVPHTRAAAAWR
jgi:hypothetical protein